MNRRILIAALTLGAFVSGATAPAFAETADTKRYKLCINDPGNHGWCAVIDDPLGQDQ